MNKSTNILLIICSVLFACVVMEIGARVYLLNFASRDKLIRYASFDQLEKTDWNKGYKFAFHRYIGYIPTPAYEQGKNRHNSLGFRGEEFPVEKPAGEFRIVCLGGSTTYGDYNDDYRDSYPDSLQRELHRRGYTQVRVINAGAGGWSTWESLINLQFRLLPLDPDLIIIYHSVNDIRARFVWPHEAYLADNSGNLLPQFTRMYTPSIWEYSTLLRIIMVSVGLVEPQVALERVINRPNRKHFYGKEFLDQLAEGRYPSGIFESVSAMDMLEINKPVYFENNLSSMIAIARQHDIDVMLSTFAYDPLHFSEGNSSSAEYIYAYTEHEAIVRRLARDNKTGFFDLNKHFPREKDLYVDGHHMTSKGTALQAKLFSDYIEKNMLSSLK